MTGERYRFGHLRCRETKKPFVFAPPVVFCRCRRCGAVWSSMTENVQNPLCCGEAMEVLKIHHAEEFKQELKLSYQIIGSLNENAVRAVWECKETEERPEWIWLRTFSGGQLKYMRQGKKSPAIFGLADEDAYAYCDKDPCVECTFRCKRGFGLYYYFKNYGIIYLPLDRMSAKQQTKPAES